MKTLIDIRLLGRGAHSGIPVFTREITERLIQSNEGAFELFYPGLHKQKLPTAWTTHPSVTVRDWNVPNKLIDGLTRWFNYPNMSRISSADIIFSPHFNNLNKGRLPRVLTVHDLSFAHHPYFFSNRQRSWHFLQDWRKQIKEAEHLIAVSHYTKEDIVKTLGINAERISVVYPGIGTEFKQLDPHDHELRQFQKRHHLEAPYFLYLGALEARKNILELVAAFDLLRTDPRHKGYELILAGSPGNGASEIARAVAASKSKSAIRILSRVTDEERKFLYNGAVAFACTSFFEGFGFPALEAQACGVPVVASNRTSFVETLTDSALLINPWKPSELADALMSLATGSRERSEAIKKGLHNVKRYNWDTAAKHIKLILERTHHAFYE